jgi:hypothetical protein
MDKSRVVNEEGKAESEGEKGSSGFRAFWGVGDDREGELDSV